MVLFILEAPDDDDAAGPDPGFEFDDFSFGPNIYKGSVKSRASVSYIFFFFKAKHLCCLLCVCE
jgi:hypothetical protein